MKKGLNFLGKKKTKKTETKEICKLLSPLSPSKVDLDFIGKGITNASTAENTNHDLLLLMVLSFEDRNLLL